MSQCAVLLATLLMYARYPMSANSPHWVNFTLPADVLPIIEAALAEHLSTGRRAAQIDPATELANALWSVGSADCRNH